jgi:hypothetical protein
MVSDHFVGPKTELTTFILTDARAHAGLLSLFSENHPGEETAPVGGQHDKTSDPRQRVVASAHMGGGATPLITALTAVDGRVSTARMSVREYL